MRWEFIQKISIFGYRYSNVSEGFWLENLKENRKSEEVTKNVMQQKDWTGNGNKIWCTFIVECNIQFLLWILGSYFYHEVERCENK